MNINYILFGLLPLLAFVIIDSFLGLKAGVVAAAILAVLEALYTIYEFGTLDSLSLASLALVLIFGLLSLKFNKAIYMKLQPVFLGLCFGLTVLVLQLFGKPILILFLEKYGSLLPSSVQSIATDQTMKILLAKLSLLLGFGFLVHAGLVAYAAFRLSNWWWLLIRGLGLYIMMAMCVFIVRIF